MAFQWWRYPRGEVWQFIWMGIDFGGQRLMVFSEERLIAALTSWNILKGSTFDVEYQIGF
jgi:hypothetical protein